MTWHSSGLARGLAGALSALALAGCAAAVDGAAEPDGADAADVSDAVDATPAPVMMQVGSSDLDGQAFVPLDGCPEVDIVHGIQGGYHIWASVRVRDVSPSKAEIRVRLRDVTTGEVVAPGDVTLSLDLDEVPGDAEPPWLERNGLPAYVADPCPIDGHELRLEGRVVDLYGVEREAQGCLVARMLPEWRFECGGP